MLLVNCKDYRDLKSAVAGKQMTTSVRVPDRRRVLAYLGIGLFIPFCDLRYNTFMNDNRGFEFNSLSPFLIIPSRISMTEPLELLRAV